MHVSGWLRSVAARALAESMDVHTMKSLAKRLFGDYDLNARVGFPDNLAIPNKNAAVQIVRDVSEAGAFIDFVTLLIQIHESGMKGRRYRIPYLKAMVGELKKEGLVYDETAKMFFEDPNLRRSRNWGVLREGVEYIFAFLRLDVVGNTKLVRRNAGDKVQKAYRHLLEIVKGIVESRNGRMWDWEGDGGLAAFYFSNMENRAALCAMEILGELYIYNLVHCSLNEPLGVRIAVHAGPCEYRSSSQGLNGETLKTTAELESKRTKPNTATFSGVVFRMLSPVIVERLEQAGDRSGAVWYTYELKWEK